MPNSTTIEPSVSTGIPPRIWLGYSDIIATVWLIGGSFCLVLALLMSVGENRRVYLYGIDEPIPELCATYVRFGIDCPGCGLTRTFIHLAHAQIYSGIQTNPVGLLVFLFTCMQVVMGSAQVIFNRRGRWVEWWGIWNDYLIAGLLVCLLLQWTVRLAFHFWS